MKAFKEIPIVLAFSLILILPMADSFLNFVPIKKVKENRVLRSKPEIDINSLDKFPGLFDKYYSDYFEFRNQYLILNSWLKFQLIGVAPVRKKAIIGEDGWMYSLKMIKNIYLGKNKVDNDELNEYYKIFNYRKNFLDSINCKYYFVLAPVKLTIYPEYHPISNYVPNQPSLSDQIVELLDSMQGLTLLDLRPVLKQAKGDIRLFNKTDTHWNDYGSFLAYESIMQTLSKEFPNLLPHKISEYSVDTVKGKGMNMLDMLGIYHPVYENKILCKPNSFKSQSIIEKKKRYTAPKLFSLKNEYEFVYTNDNDSLPKLLMIRDSFARTVIPFLKDHFSESVYIFDGWHHDFNEDIVIQEKPDIFIQFIVESQLESIYKYAQSAKK